MEGKFLVLYSIGLNFISVLTLLTFFEFYFHHYPSTVNVNKSAVSVDLVAFTEKIVSGFTEKSFVALYFFIVVTFSNGFKQHLLSQKGPCKFYFFCVCKRCVRVLYVL